MLKREQGVCGCGMSDVHSDGNTVSDCRDECPYDVNKQEVDICGCGMANNDTDGNGIANCKDLCPMDISSPITECAVAP